jgi:TBC1 domain family protein 5
MKFFQNVELEREINQDIDRTYPEHEFFQQQSVKDIMLRILFIYARQNPQLSYKQGMHELLAPLLYILDRESFKFPEESKKDENEASASDSLDSSAKYFSCKLLNSLD